MPIGVVTNIVGIRRVQIEVLGRADHAGNTPMNLRQDSLVAAAKIILAVKDLAKNISKKLAQPQVYVVATIGMINVLPNVANAVSASVEMVLEVRSDDNNILENFVEELINSCGENILPAKLEITPLSQSQPTSCSELVMQSIEKTCTKLAINSLRMPSGAGHDCAYISAIAPAGMIFVPCLGGRSHCPEEWIELSQMATGVGVMYHSLLELDKTLLK